MLIYFLATNLTSCTYLTSYILLGSYQRKFVKRVHICNVSPQTANNVWRMVFLFTKFHSSTPRPRSSSGGQIKEKAGRKDREKKKLSINGTHARLQRARSRAVICRENVRLVVTMPSSDMDVERPKSRGKSCQIECFLSLSRIFKGFPNDNKRIQ